MRRTIIIILFSLAVLCAQSFFTFFYEPFENLQVLHESLSLEKQFVWLGDSVSYWVDEKSPLDKKDIPTLLHEQIPEYHFTSIYNGGYNLGIYRYFVNWTLQKNMAVSGIVIQVNLRSFSPIWHKGIGYAFAKEKYQLYADCSIVRPLLLGFYKPLSVLKVFDIFDNTNEMQKKVPIVYQSEITNLYQFPLLFEFEKWEVNKIHANLFIKYLQKIPDNHPYFDDIAEIVKNGKQNGKPIYFVVNPIDIDEIKKYLSEDEMQIVYSNHELLIGKLRKFGATYFDYQFKFETDMFFYKDQFYPNEHLSLEGKKLLSKTLARDISKEISGSL